MRKQSKSAESSGETIGVERGSGNVFADLGLKDPEERLAKAELASRIAQLVAARRLTPDEAGTVLEIDPLALSHLSGGRLKHFSLERLAQLLGRLNDTKPTLRD